MKRYISIALAGIMALLCLSACGSAAAGNSSKPSSDNAAQPKKLQIAVTIFPEYDWIRQILGENEKNAEITLLLDRGVDLHSYQPTVEDILKISTCDLFIYIGGESDKWVEDALRETANQEMKTVNLLEVLGEAAKEEETMVGMETDHHHEDDEYEENEGGEGQRDEDWPEYDEHIWLSLKNAQILCSAIADMLAGIDPGNGEAYKANAKAYNEKLAALDTEYQAAASAASHKTLLFADRFPFRYLADDYGLSYYAAFTGCSAETQASFETITFLSGKVDELDLDCILTVEKSDQKIANAVIQNTQSKDQRILAMDSMQSITSGEISDGASYLSIMEGNLEILKEALKCYCSRPVCTCCKSAANTAEKPQNLAPFAVRQILISQIRYYHGTALAEP